MDVASGGCLEAEVAHGNHSITFEYTAVTTENIISDIVFRRALLVDVRFIREVRGLRDLLLEWLHCRYFAPSMI